MIAPLADRAAALLSLHHGSHPLVLPNAWDVPSALAVAGHGFPAVATSSRAIAQVFGEDDDDSSDPDVVFDFLRRMAGAVDVPLTADLQAGLRLSGSELAERMVVSGLAGCNLEDSKHHGTGGLRDAAEQAAFLASVRAASDRLDVHLVINARVDTFIRQSGDVTQLVDETIGRAKMYLEAGADCIYPMAVGELDVAQRLVHGIPAPVNLLYRGDGPSLPELADTGAARISFGSGIFGMVHQRHIEVLGGIQRELDIAARSVDPSVDPSPGASGGG